jgi:hypothetical protein
MPTSPLLGKYPLSTPTLTNTVTGTIPLGEEPWDTAFTPNGNTAYVTDEGVECRLGVRYRSKDARSATYLSRHQRDHITITPDGAFLYVTSVCRTSADCDINVPSTVSILAQRKIIDEVNVFNNQFNKKKFLRKIAAFHRCHLLRA